MTLEQFIKFLDIGKSGTYADNSQYVIDIDSDDEYLKIFSKLDRNSKLEQADDNSLLTKHNSSILYNYKDANQFQANLIGDFDNGQYKLVISEFVGEDGYDEETDENIDEE